MLVVHFCQKYTFNITRKYKNVEMSNMTKYDIGPTTLEFDICQKMTWVCTCVFFKGVEISACITCSHSPSSGGWEARAAAPTLPSSGGEKRSPTESRSGGVPSSGSPFALRNAGSASSSSSARLETDHCLSLISISEIGGKVELDIKNQHQRTHCCLTRMALRSYHWGLSILRWSICQMGHRLGHSEPDERKVSGRVYQDQFGMRVLE